MSRYKAGFAGAGHMGKILAGAVSDTGDPLTVSCRTKEHAEKAAEELGCSVSENKELLENSDYCFLGMRPQDFEAFLKENKETVKASDCIYISMLAGTPLERLKKLLGEDKKVIRIMPNTPCSVGKGLIFCAAGDEVSTEEKRELERMLKSCGKLEWIDEKDMDAVSVLGGCGPAYVYAYAEALSKAGESMGLTAEDSAHYAALVLLGSAHMILETGKTPEELKKEVCSPGGTTIEGVKVLDLGNLEGLTEKALQASYKKTKGM